MFITPTHISNQVKVMGKAIHRTIMDEGVATSIMSLSCWKALGSPPITPSLTIRTALNGHLFSPCGIFTALPITLHGKIVSIKVKVIDHPIDYNCLHGRD